MSIIKFKRGVKANLPVLNAGEPAYTTDTNQLYIGNGTANSEIPLVTSGTWTPVLSASINGGTHTYTTQSGKYYKIGKLVHVEFSLALSAKDSALNGNVNIYGLPFNLANDYMVGVSIGGLTGLTPTGTPTQIDMIALVNRIEFRYNIGSSQAVASEIGNNFSVCGSFDYITP